MKRNWVRFCEHVIQNDWNPEAIGEMTDFQQGHARFGSVPVIRCKTTNQGLRCVRLNKEGKWVECRRTRSLSPLKTGENLGYSDVSRWVTQEEVRQMSSLPVPNKCEAHILDHMRCRCAACMDLACRWRRALKKKMRATASGIVNDTQPKERRWTYWIDGCIESCPKLHAPIACPAERPDSETPRKKWPYVGSPRVNWWFGNYVPSSESSDDTAVCDEESDDDEVGGEKPINQEAGDESYEDGQRQKQEAEPCSSQGRTVRNESPQRETSRTNVARKDDTSPSHVTEFTLKRGGDSSSNTEENTTQTENLKGTQGAKVRRFSRGFLWSNNAKIGKQNCREFNVRNPRRCPCSPRQPGQRGALNRRYRAKSVDQVSNGDAFETAATEGLLSNEATTDHFRSVMCTDPSSKTVRTRGTLDCSPRGANAWKVKERYRRNMRELCVKKTVESGQESSLPTDIDRDEEISEEENRDRSENNRDRESRERKGKSNGKQNAVKKKPDQNEKLISEDLRRNIEELLQRDFRESNRCEEKDAAHHNNNHKKTIAKNKKCRGKSPAGNRRVSSSKTCSPRRRSSDRLSDTTRLLRKYGVGDASPSKALCGQGQGEFVLKDDLGYYHVNAETDTDLPVMGQLPQNKAGSYKSRFLKDMGWGSNFENGESDATSSNQCKKLERRVKQHTEDKQSPIYKTIKIVDGNSFWDEMWHKLSRKKTGKNKEISLGDQASTHRGRLRKSFNRFETSVEKENTELSNEPTNDLSIPYPVRDHRISSKREKSTDTESKKSFVHDTMDSLMRQKQARKGTKFDSRGNSDHSQNETGQTRDGGKMFSKRHGNGDARIRTARDGSDSDHGHISRFLLCQGSPPPTSPDSQRRVKAKDRRTSDSDLPNTLDKDRILWSPWEVDKLSYAVRAHQRRRRNNGSSRAAAGHGHESGGDGVSDNDDEDFKTASTASLDDEYTIISPRSVTREARTRDNCGGRYGSQTLSGRRNSTCKYDNLLPGDDEYVLAAKTSAVSIDSATAGQKVPRVKIFDESDSEQSIKPLDETKNCQPVNMNKLRTESRWKTPTAQFVDITSKAHRNRPMGRTLQTGKSHFHQSCLPDLNSLSSGLWWQKKQNVNKDQKIKLYSDVTLNNDRFWYEAPRGRRHSKQKLGVGRFSIPGQGKPSNKTHQNKRSPHKQTKDTDSQTMDCINLKRNAGDYHSDESYTCGKSKYCSVDWVKRRQAEKKRQLDDAHSSGTSKEVSVTWPKQGKRGAAVAFQGGDSIQDKPLETINIRGPLEIDKNRRPLVEVNIFGPLEDDEAKFQIRESRASQVNPDDVKKVSAKLGKNESPTTPPDESVTRNSEEDSDTLTNDTYRLCAKCKDQDESTNHPEIPSVKGTVQSKLISDNQGSDLYVSARGDESPCSDIFINDPAYDHVHKSVSKKGTRSNDDSGVRDNISKEVTCLNRNAFFPPFASMKNDFSVSRTLNAHQYPKMDIMRKRTDSEKAHHRSREQKNCDRKKYLLDYELTEWPLPTRVFDESNSISLLESPKIFKRIENDETKTFDGLKSQKTNLKVTANSVSKKVSRNRQADREEKNDFFILVPTGQSETGLKPRSRSRSLSVSRANIKPTPATKNKIRSSCYPSYNVGTHAEQTSTKKKKIEGPKVNIKRPAITGKGVKSNISDCVQRKVLTRKVKKYPETIWHKYIRAERENQNWSNKLAELRESKESQDLVSKETLKVTCGTSSKEEKNIQKHSLRDRQAAVEAAANTMRKEKNLKENESTSSKSQPNVDEINTSRDLKYQRGAAKQKQQSCINIKEAEIVGWTLCPLTDGSKNHSGLDSNAEWAERRSNNVWVHAASELYRPKAGHRLQYGDGFVSNQPTAKMVDEPMRGEYQLQSSSRNDDFDDQDGQGQLQPEQLPFRNQDVVCVSQNTQRHHRRDRRRPKSCCGRPTSRKPIEKSSSSTSSSTSSENSTRDRCRLGKSARRFSRRHGFKKTKKTYSFIGAEDVDNISTAAPPPSLKSELSNKSIDFKEIAPISPECPVRKAFSRGPVERENGTSVYKHQGGRAFLSHNDSETFSSSPSSEDEDSQTRALVELYRRNGDVRNNGDTFRASNRVLEEPAPACESQWKGQYESLMGDCSEENLGTSWRRMNRIEAKAKCLEGSMSRLKNNFFDIETRLDKVKNLQRDYMDRADRAVEMLRGERGRTGSRLRFKTAGSKTRRNAARSTMRELDLGSGELALQLSAGVEINKVASSKAETLGPPAKNKREETFICPPSKRLTTNQAVLACRMRQPSCDISPTVESVLRDNNEEKPVANTDCEARQEFETLRAGEGITKDLRKSRKKSESRSHSEENIARNARQLNNSNSGCPDKYINHNKQENDCLKPLQKHLSKCGMEDNDKKEKSKGNITTNTDSSHEGFGRGAQSNKHRHMPTICPVSKDTSANNSNYRESPWSDILSAYQTWFKRPPFVHGDTENAWTDQFSSYFQLEENGNCVDNANDFISKSFRPHQLQCSFNLEKLKDSGYEQGINSKNKSLQQNIDSNDSINTDIEKTANLNRHCSRVEDPHGVLDMLSKLMSSVLSQNREKGQLKSKKIFMNTNKSLSRVYARSAQPSTSCDKSHIKIHRLKNHRSRRLSELPKYRRADEASVCTQQLKLRSSSVPCRSRRQRSSRSCSSRAGPVRRPTTSTQLCHEKICYEKSRSKRRPTSGPRTPKLEVIDKILNRKETNNKLREFYAREISRLCSDNLATHQNGSDAQTDPQVHENSAWNKIRLRPSRELHVHLPRGSQLPVSSSTSLYPLDYSRQVLMLKPLKRAQTRFPRSKFSWQRKTDLNLSTKKNHAKIMDSTCYAKNDSVYNDTTDVAPCKNVEFDYCLPNIRECHLASPPTPPSSPVDFCNEKFGHASHIKVQNIEAQKEEPKYSNKLLSPRIHDFKSSKSKNSTSYVQYCCGVWPSPQRQIEHKGLNVKNNSTEKPSGVIGPNVDKPNSQRLKFHLLNAPISEEELPLKSNHHFRCVPKTCREEAVAGDNHFNLPTAGLTQLERFGSGEESSHHTRGKEHRLTSSQVAENFEYFEDTVNTKQGSGANCSIVNEDISLRPRSDVYKGRVGRNGSVPLEEDDSNQCWEIGKKNKRAANRSNMINVRLTSLVPHDQFATHCAGEAASNSREYCPSKTFEDYHLPRNTRNTISSAPFAEDVPRRSLFYDFLTPTAGNDVHVLEGHSKKIYLNNQVPNIDENKVQVKQLQRVSEDELQDPVFVEENRPYKFTRTLDQNTRLEVLCFKKVHKPMSSFLRNSWSHSNEEHLYRSKTFSHEMSPYPISDGIEGGLAGPATRVRFTNPIPEANELPRSLVDSTRIGWKGSDPHITSATHDRGPLNGSLKDRASWDSTRRVLHFLAGCSLRDLQDYMASLRCTRSNTRYPARPLSADPIALGRRYDQTDSIRLADMPASLPRLLSARQQRASLNFICPVRKSDSSGYETNCDLDIDS